MSTRHAFFISTTLLGLCVATQPAIARACAIDNVASLSANGVPAMLVTDPPAGKGPWTPFVLAQAFAPGAPVRLEEAQADLARTLPAEVRAGPFRWVFGDGTLAVGRSVVHRYAHPGRYYLLIYGFYRRERRWFAFDSALVRVVPGGEVLRANLEYDVLQAMIALSGLTWPVDGALVGAVLILLLRLSARHPVAPCDRAAPDL